MAAVMKHYLEYIGGNSRKFWEIEVHGRELHRRWGRIGTNGQSKVDVHSTHTQACAAAYNLVQSKLSEGYRETVFGQPAPSTPTPSKPAEDPVDVKEVVALLAELQATEPINKQDAVEAAAALYRELRGE